MPAQIQRVHSPYHAAESFSCDKIATTQMEKLRATIRQASKAAFYQHRFAETGISANNLKDFSHFQQLPFTTKEDLRGQYPNHLCCVPRNELVRMHCSSGTTGTPVAICYTQHDLVAWAELMARSMAATGIRAGDAFQNMAGYGLFTGGLGIHYGAERLGCLTIPAGAGNTRRQIKLLHDFSVSAIHILPSYALHLAAVLAENQQALPALRIALVGAEPYTEETRRRIEEMLQLKVFNSFGLSEMNGPGVGIECEAQSGLHLWEDAFFVEIINPDTGEEVADGEIGELVMSTLDRQGMPILRYRTRDLTRFLKGDCPCGRQHRRIDRILGRSDDMFIMKGVNIYPMQIEEVLLSFSEVGNNYLILLEVQDSREVLRIKVELHPAHFHEDMRLLHGLQTKIAQRLRDEILVLPKIDLVAHNSLPRTEGKAKRVVDRRVEEK